MAEAQRAGGLYLDQHERYVNAFGEVVDGPDGEEAGPYDGWTKNQFVAEAKERGLDVTRTDGKDGAPRVEDYLAALTEDDAKE